MCTYQTANVPVSGSGKGAGGWFPLTAATVYLDHPVDAPADHTLNIDFRNPDRGAAARVAVGLDPPAPRRGGGPGGGGAAPPRGPPGAGRGHPAPAPPPPRRG